MAVRRFTTFALIGFLSVVASAQVPPAEKAPLVSPVYVDPVCPVSSFGTLRAPNATQDMRVYYFPGAKEATIKDPQSLTLYAGINGPHWANNNATIPFEKKDDHWEAVVSIEKFRANYALFYIKDDKSHTVDDHAGKLWEVLFCTSTGERNINSVQIQAESYTGAAWPLGIRRERDYAKAVSILESFLASDPRAAKASMLRESLWNYKAERDGGDAKAWAGVADEIDKYVQSHLDEWPSVRAIGNYIVRMQDKLPLAFVDRVIPQIDALHKDSKHPLKAQLMYSRAIRVRDTQQRIAALDEFIKAYPDAIEVVFAIESKFYLLASQKDLPAAEATFNSISKAKEAHKSELYSDFNDHNLYLTLANLYIEKGVKLDEALKLADQAREVLMNESHDPGVTIPQNVVDSVEAQIATTKARAYLGLKQPQQATAEAQKAVDKRKSAQSYYVLAQALAAAKEKHKALDAYFEALLLPSNSDLKFAAELQQYYLKQGFGNEAHFQAELERRKQERFKSANYKPSLTDKPASAFEFTSLTGEKFSAATLTGKIAVINFWSPG